MALSDYKSEYLGAGWHEVVVGVPEDVTAKKGTPGVRFPLRGEGGKTKVTFWLTEKALVFLASFATACGLTEAELKTYDENNPNSHNILTGKRVKVLVEGERGADRKMYHNVDTTWCSASDPTPMPIDPAPVAAPRVPPPSDSPF